jgi:ABC-2 type transport system ATP-binding protein
MSRPAGDAVVDAVVIAEGLCKRFGKTEALRGLDLRVARGSVCGVLGPNGAGKTTAVRILTTLVRPDSGRAWVAGHDVVRDPQRVRYRIGLAGQHAAVDEKLSGRDNLRTFGRLYHLSERASRLRSDELLERFDLVEAGARAAGTYSGGMRRRLDLIASLIEVLFLDEPTAGLDPASRNQIWDSVRELVREGTTVLLTTQYLDEADHLADLVAVVDNGRVVASGTPDELKATIGNQLDVVVHDARMLAIAVRSLALAAGAEPEVVADQRRVTVGVHAGSVVLTEVVRALDRSGVVVEDIALRRPTLDEVFLQLTSARAGRKVGVTP